MAQKPNGCLLSADTEDSIVERVVTLLEAGLALYSLGSRGRAFRAMKRRTFYLNTDVSGGGEENRLYFSWRE